MDNSAYNSNNTIQNSLSNFLNSNSLVAKVSFLLLVIFVFIIILQLSINFLGWFFNSSDSPHLIDGMVDASQLLIFPQDPSLKGARTINRSVNENNGIEFTWSVWVFIKDLGNSHNKYQHVFHKGNETMSDNGLNFPNNAPGLYISPHTNELTIIFNTYEAINEEIIVPNVPLNKWVNVIIRCENTNIDVYINGTITKSVQLLGVPKQNYGNVYVGMNGGFNGFISNLWYYNHALGTLAIQNLVKRGPNTRMDSSSSISMKNPNYLSLRWYFFGNGDQYNP